MKNHFVPEFYFEPWLDANRHLLQFGWRPHGLHSKLKTPGQICYRHDLHTFNEMISPERRHAVEEWLTKSVDTETAPVIEKILATGINSIDNTDPGRLAHFIKSLIVRSPERIEMLIRGAPVDFAEQLNARNDAVQQELVDAGVHDAPSLLEYAQRHRPGLIENFGHQLIPEIISEPRRAEWLLGRKWWTVDYTGTDAFPQITSDRGVTYVGLSFDDPKSIVILPLSPSLVLYITSEEDRVRLQKLGKGWLGVNTIKTVAVQARTFVYGTRETNRNLLEKSLRRPVDQIKKQ